MASEVEQKLLNKKNARNVNFKSVTEEKIEEAKKKSLQIVENLLESCVSKELLTNLCNSISQDDYLDVIEERNILLLCGYPLCPKEVKLIKQKYHISVKSNKVYDISERKCFCSNSCYKASNFLKAQLCSSPIWLKEKDADDEPITLLCTTKNSGSAGEEVDLGHTRLTADDIQWVPEKESENSSESMYTPYTLDDLETCASNFENLEISEHCTYPLNADSLESTLLSSRKNSQDDGVVSISTVQYDGDHISLVTEHCVENVNSTEQPAKQCSYVNSDDNDEGEDCNKLLQDHTKYESLILNNKYMPIIPKGKERKALFIDPLGNPDDIVNLSPITENAGNPLEVIQNALMVWITVETFNFILGENKFKSVKNEILEKAKSCRTAESQLNEEGKLKNMKESYIKICMKLDIEEDIELNNDSVGSNNKDASFHHKNCEEQIPENEEALEQMKVSNFYKGEFGLPETPPLPPANKKKSGKKAKSTPGKSNKRNSGKVPIKMKKMEPVTASTSRECSVLPVVESLSQTAIRRQIVADHLKIVYFKLLPLIGLHYCDICEDFQLLLSTFSLTSSNISFKPSEWKMIAAILFRMMEKKLPTGKAWAQEKCWQLLEANLISFNISLDQIDSVISSVTHHSHFEKLLLGY